MGLEMGIWAVQALHIEGGVDELSAIATVRERIDKLTDAAIQELVGGPWLADIDDGGYELVEVLTTSESATYRAAAIAQVKDAIMGAASEVFFGGHHRDRCRFTDSARRQWIMTGGLAPGEPPTDSCHVIEMLAEIGISIELVSLPTNSLCCPKCSGTSELGSIESVKGFCHILIDADNDDWTFGGRTDMNWDSTTSIGWMCRSCNWATDNPQWIEQFSIPALA